MQPHRLTALVAVLALLAVHIAHAEPPAKNATDNFTFVVIGDPQLGLYSDNKDMEYEIPRLTKAVETINRIKPAFVLMDGDLINCTSESKPEGMRQAQIDKFKSIISKIDKSIPVHLVSGNHELTNFPTPQTVEWYRKTFGEDRYTFQVGNNLFIVLNSSLIAHPEKVTAERDAQKDWLIQQLAAAQKSGITSITIFQHHPWFLKTTGEKDTYDNLPLQARGEYLPLFQKYNVHTVVCGHLHYPLTAEDAGVKIVVVGSTGKSFRGESGLVVGHSESGTIQFTYHVLSKWDELTAASAQR